MNRTLALLLLLGTPSLIAADLPWREKTRVQNLEEEAGGQASLMGGGHVFGVTFGSGTRLKNLPVLGDYEGGAFYNADEEGLYASLGMTVRLMPRWRIAPFVGIGGSYNQSMSGETTEMENGREITRGASYLAGIAEAGFRATYPDRFLDFSLRYALPDLDADDAEYAYLRMSYGFPLER